MQGRSLCHICAHFRSGFGVERPEPSCAAFPGGIPTEVRIGEFDHRRPHPEQVDDTLFELKPGEDPALIPFAAHEVEGDEIEYETRLNWTS